MPSVIARAQRPVVRQIGKRLAAADTPEQMRAFIDRVTAILLVPTRGVTRSNTTLGGLAGLRIEPKASNSDRGLLMFHGGGYVFGSPSVYRHMAGRMAKAAGATVHVPSYRLAPEHPHPAAIEDGLAAYRAILDDHEPDRLAVGGDSAGGNMTLAVLTAARDEGLPMPACVVLMSPWTDLTATGDSWTTNVDSELLIRPEVMQRATEWYCGDRDVGDPRLSPLFADVRGLPPMIIQVSDEELLYSDSTALAEAAGAAGVDVRLEVSNGMWHVWQLQAPVVPEARASIESAGAFIRHHTTVG
jgi:acetyl esterase/lipase